MNAKLEDLHRQYSIKETESIDIENYKNYLEKKNFISNLIETIDISRCVKKNLIIF